MTDQETVFTWQHPGSWSGDPANILKHLNAIAAKIVGSGSLVTTAYVMEGSHQGKGDICLGLESPIGGARSTAILCHQDGGGFFHLFVDRGLAALVLDVLNKRFSD